MSLRSTFPGFPNYQADQTRASPLNLAVARVILGGYLAWKTVWYDWHVFVGTPFTVTDSYAWAIPPVELLVVEKYLLVATLLLFAVGYRVGATSFASALLVSHLAAVRYALYLGGNTTGLFIGAYALLFFGIYRHQDVLSVDELRHAATLSADALRDHLRNPPRASFRHDPLRMTLLALAIIFFGSGLDKLLAGGTAWIGPSNLSRLLVTRAHFYGYDLGLGGLIVEYPIVSTLATVGTLVVEMGILVAVVLGVSLTLPMLGVLGLMVVIPVTMGIVFPDVFFLVAMLFAWDRLDSALASDREIDLVFDDHCLFCMRSLYPFKLLDTDGQVTFYPQSAAPAAYREFDGVDFERSMFVFHDDHAYEGYWAFRELIGQFGLLRPVGWLMGRRPVAWVGERVYRYVANNRSRHFACAVDLDGADLAEADDAADGTTDTDVDRA